MNPGWAPLLRSWPLLLTFVASLPPEGDALSARQHDAAGQPDGQQHASPRCLKHMHIPKTGGCSVEAVRLLSDRKPFASLADGVYEEAAAAYKTSAKELWRSTHSSLTAFRLWHANNSFFTRSLMPDGQSCYDLHAPPGLSDRARRFFLDGGCDVFCAVREPLDRLLSVYKLQYMLHDAQKCTLAGFERFVQGQLRRLAREEPYASNCMLAPQVESVLGPRRPGGAAERRRRPFCDRILRFESLTRDFNRLMAEFGRMDVTLDQHIVSQAACNISLAGLSQESKKVVHELYREDYEAFGYPPP